MIKNLIPHLKPLPFDTHLGSNGFAIGVTPHNNNLFITGAFTTFNGNSEPNMVIIDKDTAKVNTTFKSGLGTGFNAYTIDMKIIGGYGFAVGNFTTYNGSTRQRIVKFGLTDGTIDTTFNSSNGFNNATSRILEHGAAMLVCGVFTVYRGTARNYVCRVNNTDATVGNTFDTSTGPNAGVWDLLFETGGTTNLFICGAFTTYKGSTRQRIAKVNATTAALDGTFNTTTGANNEILCMAYYNSTNLLIGGYFTSYKGTTCKCLAKINHSTGNLDASFDMTTGFEHSVSNPRIEQILIDGNSYIYVVGRFTSYKGNQIYGVAKLNYSDGSFVSEFNPGFSSSIECRRLTLVGQYLYVTGDFTSVNGSMSRNIVVKLDAKTGKAW